MKEMMSGKHGGKRDRGYYREQRKKHARRNQRLYRSVMYGETPDFGYFSRGTAGHVWRFGHDQKWHNRKKAFAEETIRSYFAEPTYDGVHPYPLAMNWYDTDQEERDRDIAFGYDETEPCWEFFLQDSQYEDDSYGKDQPREDWYYNDWYYDDPYYDYDIYEPSVI